MDFWDSFAQGLGRGLPNTVNILYDKRKQKERDRQAKQKQEEAAKKQQEAEAKKAEEQRAKEWHARQQEILKGKAEAYKLQQKAAEDAAKQAALESKKTAWQKEFEARMKPYVTSGIVSPEDMAIHNQTLGTFDTPGSARSYISSIVSDYRSKAKPKAGAKPSADERRSNALKDAQAKFQEQYRPGVSSSATAIMAAVLDKADPKDRSMLVKERYSWAPALAIEKAQQEYDRNFKYASQKPNFVEWAATQSTVAPYVQQELTRERQAQAQSELTPQQAPVGTAAQQPNGGVGSASGQTQEPQQTGNAELATYAQDALKQGVPAAFVLKYLVGQGMSEDDAKALLGGIQ